jgi:hypothetical protein
MTIKKAYSRAANLVLDNPALVTATAFVSARQKVRVTWKRRKKGKRKFTGDLTITIGHLNHAERKYVKKHGLPNKAVSIKA